MAVFRDVRNDGRRGTGGELNTKTVVEYCPLQGFDDVFVIRQQRGRQILQQGRAAVLARKNGGEKIAVQVCADMAACFVIADSTKLPVKEPGRVFCRGCFSRHEISTAGQIHANAVERGRQNFFHFTFSEPSRLAHVSHGLLLRATCGCRCSV